MDRQLKAVSKLVALTLANISVIGFGLAIYQNRPMAFIAGLLAIIGAIIIEWRAEE